MNSNIMFLNNPECFTTQKMCDKAVQKKSNHDKICSYSL